METQRIGAKRSSGPEERRFGLPISVLIGMVCIVLWLIADGGRGHDIHRTQLWEWLTFDAAHPARPGLIIHPLLHGSWPHLLAVVITLATIGRFLENRWGSIHFGIFYLGAALVGGVAVLVVDLCRGGTAAGVAGGVDVADGRGAAGGPFALGGAAAALACLSAYSVLVEDGVLMGWVTRRQAIWAGMILGSAGLVALEGPVGDGAGTRLLLTPQIAGIAWGLIACLPRPQGRPRREDGSAAKSSGRPDVLHEDAIEMHQRVDEILSKISRSGMDSLSLEEKSFLQSASKHFRNQP